MEFAFNAFQALWNRKQGEHIALSEIEAFSRIYSVYDVERFATLIMHCDQCVHDTAEAMKEEQDKRDEAKKLREDNG